MSKIKTKDKKKGSTKRPASVRKTRPLSAARAEKKAAGTTASRRQPPNRGARPASKTASKPKIRPTASPKLSLARSVAYGRTAKVPVQTKHPSARKAAPAPSKTVAKGSVEPARKPVIAKLDARSGKPVRAVPGREHPTKPLSLGKGGSSVATSGRAPTPSGLVASAPRVPVLSPQQLAAANAARLAALSKASGFSTGDFVVYPTHGVGKIVATENRQIAGQDLQLFVINFEKDRMTLRLPIAKARTSGLRRLATRKEMQTALTKLKGRSRARRTMWSRRAQEYEAKINSGDPTSIAEVVRDLHRNAGQPDQSYSERQIYQAALDRLAREFAAIEKIDEESAAQRLEQMLSAV
jgi:CarD family transcriptional regulator